MYVQNNALATTAAVVVGVSAVVALYSYLCRKKFVKVGRVKRLLVYPVKSLEGIEVDGFTCTYEGPVWKQVKDRCLLIVRDGEFICQRQEPSLRHVKVTSDGQKLFFNAEGLNTLCVEADDPELKDKPTVLVIVRKNQYHAVDCGEEAADWLKKFLKKDENFRLVRVVSHVAGRHRGRRGSVPMFFQDRDSYHIASEASLEDLNSRMPEDNCTFENFRPNVIVEGCAPYEEDYWEHAKVGEAVMTFTNRCFRCLMTTVNSEGIRTDKEPLVTLRKYRVDPSEAAKQKYSNHPLFGTRYCLYKEGNAFVGDDIYAVISNKPLL